MLTTRLAVACARPLEPRPNREEGIIWFVTDVRGHKDDEIAAAHDVGFVIIDHKDKAYLSISGRAAVTQDEAKARAI